MQRRRILIITNGHLCRNPRPLKEAQALGGAGFNVTVLAVRSDAASEQLDQELLRGAPFARECVDIGSAPGVAFLRRAKIALARAAARHLRVLSMASLGPASALLARARQVPADLTIVHNEVPHWVGLQLMREGRRVAADLEDWHSEDLLPADRIGRPITLLREQEHALLHRCVYTTTTSHALANALHERYGGTRPHVLTNSFPLQPLAMRQPTGTPASFFWFSQTLGPGRGLEPFIAAWAQTRTPSQLVLLGEDRAGFAARLRDATPPDRRSQLVVRPPVSPDVLPGLIAKHDIGLALEERTIVNRNLTITNKILQYLNAGLAVVASDTAGQREVLGRAPDAGTVVQLEDAGALRSSLEGLLAAPARLAQARTAARKLAEDVYCWERERPRFLALVEAALAART